MQFIPLLTESSHDYFLIVKACCTTRDEKEYYVERYTRPLGGIDSGLGYNDLLKKNIR
jgi:hypothetical protein